MRTGSGFLVESAQLPEVPEKLLINFFLVLVVVTITINIRLIKIAFVKLLLESIFA